MSFRTQLKQFFARTFKGNLIEVALPKKFLLECGFPNKLIAIRKGTLENKVSKHNICYEQIKCLDTGINSPLMVFRSESVRGAFVVIIGQENQEGLLCCTVKESERPINKLLINEITSIHGRNINQLIKWIEDGYLIGGQIEKTKKVVGDSGFNCLQCDYLLSLLDSAILIHKNGKTNEGNKNLSGTTKNQHTMATKKQLEALAKGRKKLAQARKKSGLGSVPKLIVPRWRYTASGKVSFQETTNAGDFLEEFFPDYYYSSEITYLNDLSQLADGEMTKKQFKEEWGEDFGKKSDAQINAILRKYESSLVAKAKKNFNRMVKDGSVNVENPSKRKKTFSISACTAEDLMHMYHQDKATANSGYYEEELASIATDSQKRKAYAKALQRVWGKNLQKAPFDPGCFKSK